MTAAVEALAGGRPVLVLDEFRRFGMVGLAARYATPEMTNFLTGACRGIVYVGLPGERLDALEIAPQPRSDGGPANLRMPVDLRAGVTTGISAADRSRTVLGLLDPLAASADFRRPGHVTPVEVHPDGVLGRPRVPEALQDLSTLAGCGTGVMFCSVLDDQGGLASPASLVHFAAEHDLPSLRICDVVRLQRRRRGPPVGRGDLREIDLPFLRLRLLVRGGAAQGLREHLPVAVHRLCARACLAPDACACTPALEHSRARLEGAEGAVVLVCPTSDVATSWAHAASVPEDEALGDLVAALLVGGHAAP